MKKRCLLFLLALAMVLSFMAVPTMAVNGEGQTYEVVLLIDSSGSMNYADPNRVTVEAVKSFAMCCPTEAESFKISVVLYNTEILTAIRGADVKTADGKESFQATMAKIGSMNRGEEFNGFKLWTGETDIGAAIVEADRILTASAAAKKTVVLFTDGKIDLDNNFGVTTEAEKQSRANSYTCAEKFGEAKIPMHTVGLNYNNGVDKDFLGEMASITGGKYFYGTTANELIFQFTDVFAEMVGADVVDKEEIVVQPDVDTTYAVTLHGQAIREAQLAMNCSAAIGTFKVINPRGVVVAEGKEDGTYSTVDPENCIIERTELAVNIKLLRPADGEWSLVFTAKARGTAMVRTVCMCDLTVVTEVPDSVDVGETVIFRPAIYNRDTESWVTSQAAYETSTCTITISEGGTNNTYSAKLNDSKDGFVLEHKFNQPGTYSYTGMIDNDQFSVPMSGSIVVLGPELALSASTTACQKGDSVVVSAQIVDSKGNAIDMPSYLAGGECNFELKKDGQTIKTLKGNYQPGGKFTCSFDPAEVGSYEVVAKLERRGASISSAQPVNVQVWEPTFTLGTATKELILGDTFQADVTLRNPITGDKLDGKMEGLVAIIKLDGQELSRINIEGTGFSFKPEKVGQYTVSVTNEVYTSEELTFSVGASVISADGKIDDISGTVLFDEIKQEIELNDIFKDSDGDKLTYEVTVDGEGVDVDVDDNGVLTVVAQGGAQGTVTVKVSDGRGAEQVVTFNVGVESLMTLFIIIVVAVVVIILAVIILLIVVKKRSVPRIRYRVRVVLDPMGAGTEAVYEMSRASNNRRCKQVMTLKEIMELSTLTSEISSNLTEDQYIMILQNFASKISVTGFPFKDGLKITTPDGKTKSFTSAIATVQLKSDKPEDDTVVQFSFGKTTAL